MCCSIETDICCLFWALDVVTLTFSHLWRPPNYGQTSTVAMLAKSAEKFPVHISNILSTVSARLSIFQDSVQCQSGQAHKELGRFRKPRCGRHVQVEL